MLKLVSISKICGLVEFIWILLFWESKTTENWMLRIHGQHRRVRVHLKQLKHVIKAVAFCSCRIHGQLHCNLILILYGFAYLNKEKKEDGREKIWLQNYVNIYLFLNFQTKFNSLCYLSLFRFYHAYDNYLTYAFPVSS